MMKKLTVCMTLSVIVMMMASCKGASERELTEQLDSLQAAYNQRNADYEDLSGYLSVLSEGLDSIAAQEGQLFAPKEGPQLSRAQIKENLNSYKETLSRQRERIAQLEEQLKAGKGNAAKLQTIINTLKQQLEQKDEELELLRTEVNDKNMNIESLKAYIQRLRQRNQTMADRLTAQETTLTAQDKQLNEAYIKIGPKAELKKLGLLNGGGLFKKSKVDFSQLDKSLFSRKDIRNIKHIEMLSKKAKVLTPQPTDSYEIEVAEGNAVLVITNAKKFWSVTNYLIIQTD